MKLLNKKVGFTLTGSFCTFNKAIEQMENIKKQQAKIIPIMSYNSYNFDTKFGNSKDFIDKIENICETKIIHTIQDAEPIGPCSGNTIAKLANGITDSPALMAAKSHLRNSKPLVIAISTNDGLSRKC